MPDELEENNTGANVKGKTDKAARIDEQSKQITFSAYDKKDMLHLQMTVELHEENNLCSGEIIELYSYPEKIENYKIRAILSVWKEPGDKY